MAKRSFLQLAHVYDPQKHDPSGWWMSEKLDGMRAFWDGGITRNMMSSDIPFADQSKKQYIATGLWSRYANPIFAPEWFLDQLPDFPLDGELYCGVRQFQQVMSACKKYKPEDHEWRNVTYRVFESPPTPVLFADGHIKEPQIDRLFRGVDTWYNEQLNGRVLKCPRPFRDNHIWLRRTITPTNNLWVHPHAVLPFNAEAARQVIMDEVHAITDKGGEGVIIREPGAYWKPERTHKLLKVKSFLDAEATVLGYVSGQGKYLGMIGAVVCKFNIPGTIKNVMFELSGFTDAERTLANNMDWARVNPGCRMPPDTYARFFTIGEKITFRYRELSRDGVPKEARYWRHHS